MKCLHVAVYSGGSFSQSVPITVFSFAGLGMIWASVVMLVKRGDAIVRITQDDKELVIASPISGEIQHVHTSLRQYPGAISEDPYTSWLYKIKPEKWSEETRRYYLAGEATEWLKTELTRFKDFMAETTNQSPGQAVLVLQEGGELMDNPLAEMNEEVWSEFQVKFLDTEH